MTPTFNNSKTAAASPKKTLAGHVIDFAQRSGSARMPLVALLHRDLSTSVNSAGGYTVEDTLQDTILEELRPHSVTLQAGARYFTNLRGNFIFPYLSTAALDTVTSGETATISVDTTAAFAQPLALTPQRISTSIDISLQLAQQAKDRQILDFIRDSIARGLATTLDQLALVGSSSLGYQPIVGLVNNPNLTTITYGGTVSWAQVQTQIANVTKQNFGLNNRAWAASPAAIEKLSQVEIISGSNFPKFIYCDHDQTIAGYPVVESSNLTGNQMIFGKWDELAVCLWGNTVDVIADPFTLAPQGILRLTVNMLANAGVLRPGFSPSTDSAAQ